MSYLRWAIEHYPDAAYDLATSGARPVSLADALGNEDRGCLDPQALDDRSARHALVNEIAAYNDVEPCEVLPTLGTAHALYLAYRAVPAGADGYGREALVESPAYEPLVTAALAAGLKVRRFPRFPRARYSLDPPAIEALLTPATRVVSLSTLHNPSGIRADPAALEALASACGARGIALLVDEVYAAFDALGTLDGRFGASARKLSRHVIAVGSLTKAYGLGAHRVGWLLGDPRMVRRAEDAVHETCGPLGLSHAAIGAACFRALPRLAAITRSRLAERRRTVCDWVRGRSDLAWSEPREGLFGFVQHRSGIDLRPTIERGIAEEGVVVAPGSFFDEPGSFRLAWSADEPSLAASLLRLGRVLDRI